MCRLEQMLATMKSFQIRGESMTVDEVSCSVNIRTWDQEGRSWRAPWCRPQAAIFTFP